MTLKSKRTLASIMVSAVSLTGYLVYALGKSAPETDNLKTWAIVILIAVGISIAAQIVTQIVFHIVVSVGLSVKERECDGGTVQRIIKSEMSEDERDKIITLKASHIGYSLVGAGIAAMLIALACGTAAVVGLHILLGACFTAMIADGIASIFLMEKGAGK